MPTPIIEEGLKPVEVKLDELPNPPAVNEKVVLAVINDDEAKLPKDSVLVLESEVNSETPDNGKEEAIIITGADAAEHLLPMRDDFEPSLTFRCLFLATGLSAFQAVMSQIYSVCYHVTYMGFNALYAPLTPHPHINMN